MRKSTSKKSNFQVNFSQKWSECWPQKIFPLFRFSLRGFVPKNQKNWLYHLLLIALKPQKVRIFHYFEFYAFWDTLMTKKNFERLIYHFFHVRNHPKKFRQNFGGGPQKCSVLPEYSHWTWTCFWIFLCCHLTAIGNKIGIEIKSPKEK